MNFVAALHIIAALVVIGAAIPLMRGRVKMNPWYGIRIPPAFESEERWREINRYGGRLLLVWGIVIALFGMCGLLLGREWLVTYSVVAFVLIISGLVLMLVLTYRYAKKSA